jgi:hypothetical protein
MNKLHTSVYLDRFNTKKDRTVSITFSTNEKTGKEIGELHELTGSFGYMIFKPEDQLTKDEIKAIDELDTEVSGKTKAQRLRAVLWVSHKANDEGYDDFVDYYAHKMEELIEHFKSKLE